MTYDESLIDTEAEKTAVVEEDAAEARPIARREVLAFVALQADLPMPSAVQMVDMMSDLNPAPALRLRFHGPGAEQAICAWGERLGLVGKVMHHDYSDGNEPHRMIWQTGSWRAFDKVMITATVLTPSVDVEPPLAEATEGQLRELAGGEPR